KTRQKHCKFKQLQVLQLQKLHQTLLQVLLTKRNINKEESETFWFRFLLACKYNKRGRHTRR
ncbi:hypothetical protein EFR33_10070, partial [Lactobacillus delbrueckii subsp. lactis]|nr:hypothetical protein [Lactobacillus delbrueckii subsp. lactis]